MSKKLYDKRMKEFINYVKIEHRLPKVWEVSFSDGYDMRLWINGVSTIKEYKGYYNEVVNILNSLGIKMLDDKEKEKEFINYIDNYGQIPMYGDAYFSDNSNMRMWYLSYKDTNKLFERKVRDMLPEYQNFNIVEVWPLLKEEFVSVLSRLKRVPNYGEFITNGGLDIRLIYDKLESFDANFIENLLIEIKSSNSKLSIDDRIHQLLDWISNVGYIPYLQEARFSDGIDMFTWYYKYKDNIPLLREKVYKLVYKLSTKKVNIYLIPNFRKNGGKFYTICSNEGEKLDLSGVNSFDEAKKLESSLVKRGGVILKQDEEIESISFVKGKKK